MRLYLCFAQKGNQGTASTIGGSPSERALCSCAENQPVQFEPSPLLPFSLASLKALLLIKALLNFMFLFNKQSNFDFQ